MNETLVQQRVGKRIRSCRLRAGLTQQDLGHALGLTRSSISNIEAGSQSLSLVAFLKIAQELEIDPGVLLQGLTEAGDLRTAVSEAGLPDVYHSWVEALKRDDAPDGSFATVTP